jgi:hypothetical protein
MNNRSYDAPIIVGGTGGSGTRVIQMLLEKAGIFMGKNLNEHKDNYDVHPYLIEAIPALANGPGRGLYAGQSGKTALLQDYVGRFYPVAKQLYSEVPEEAIGWGWKHPRMIYLFPLMAACFANARFIHMVRDGRDMAISGNQNQYNSYYSLFCGPVGRGGMPSEESIHLWSFVNQGAYHWAMEHIKSRYHVVRFEDLASKPEEIAAGVCNFLEIEPHSLKAMTDHVEQIPSIGRFRQLSKNELAKIEYKARDALTDFGYELAFSPIERSIRRWL